MFKDVALNKLQEIYVEEVISSRKDITSSFLEKRDTCCNLKNWDINKYNILFITGLSGSGKTTLGVDMKKEFNCKRVELDYIVLFYMKRCNASRKDKVYNLVKEECEEAVEFFDNNKDTWSIDTWAEHEPISRAFLDWFTSKFEGNGQLYIINGAQIPDVCDVEYFEERPIIVKDSNAIKSVLRRTHREIDEETLIKKIIQFSKHIKMITKPEYIKSSIRMTKFAKDINNESYIEESKNDILEKIKIFNKDLCKYEYIIVQPNGKIIEEIKRDSFKNYRILSPSKFKQYNGGICWDYVVYEASYFTFTKFKTFFFCIVDEEGNPKSTHTFLLFYLDNKVYWFEASWKSNLGIFEFNNEDEALSFITNKLVKEIELEKNDFYLVEYTPSKYINNTEYEFLLAMSKLPEYKYKYIKDVEMNTIQHIKINNGKIIDESYIEESSNRNIYYRVTYNDIGIYEALKQNIDSNIWKDLLKSSNINWLPKPPLEYNSNISYFTEEGYKIFKKKTLPDIEKYLNKENIYTEEISAYTIKDNIVYSDKYQVVISNTIQEASSYDRKYRCPYCDKLYKRKDLPSHIENKHEDLIPQEMTPLQVTFNSINNKTHGVCTECGGESPWNEAKGRYDRICGKKSCHDSYVKTMKSRMVKKYGREHNLNDAQVQANMLNNRKISGTYIWSDRTKFSYCGSYEKNLLEFLDKVLECKSEDILTPGPVIEYSYNGEIHQWITDLYYIPYNLCFDVKDGGDNPNNRPMKEYRDKQEAKEIAIIEQNKYNYIRLTDNNFTQLFEIFLELKMKLEDSNEKVVHINEQCSTTLNALPNINAEKGQYIIQYMAKNTFTKGYAYTTNNELTDDIHIIDNFGKENIIYRDQFLNMVEEYTIYKYIGDHIEESYNCTTYPIDYFYIKLTGRRLIDENQILVDSEFTKELTLEEKLESLKEVCKSSLSNSIPIEEGNIGIDKNGVYMYNKDLGLRTSSYETMEKINNEEIKIIEGNR